MAPTVIMPMNTNGKMTRRITPITLRPIASDADIGMNNCEQAAQESPARRQPSLQHPTNCCAHSGHRKPHTNDGVTAQKSSQHEDDALGWHKLRHVARLV